MSRYARQQQVPQLGAASEQAFADTKVLLVGVGGLGSPVASLLAGAGVGHLTLVDHDTVALSNLHRQTLFTEDDVGLSKVLAAQQRLQKVNSGISITAIESSLAPDNVESLVADHTIVVDAADSFFVSYLLSDVCMHLGVPLVSASVLQTSGYVGVFCGDAHESAPSMRAIFPCPPITANTCSTAGVTGPSVGVIGAIQAQEVIKVILKDRSRLLGKVLYLDLWDYQQNIVSFDHAQEPKFYAGLINESSVNKGDVLLDVRSAQEVLKSPRARPCVNIPVNEIGARHQELERNQPIVCVCKSGQRALNAAHQLMMHGFEHVKVAI